MNHYGVVAEVIEGRGVYVESMMGGQTAKYGPMHYLSSTGEAVIFAPGDSVLFTNVGRIADNFIILGKVVDPTAPGYFPLSDVVLP